MLLRLGRAAAAMLPDRWFELHGLGDAGFETGRDHHMLERIGGPPIGSFHVWRHDGRVHAEALPELDPVVGEMPWRGSFRDESDAVRAIAGVVDAQLRAWMLPPPGPAEDLHDTVVIALRPDLVRTFVSRSSRDIMGYTPAELLGGHPSSVIHAEDWPRIQPLLDLCRQIEEPVRDTHRVRHKDGSLIWMEGRYTAHMDGAYTVLLRDVTRGRPPQ